ncbi:Gfo/Idh/MocA family protein [Inquilinus limosus]|uniref:Gfo/Idh/MocA family protein n=1 Tax=Inquilinus limosus TaxID=171674 RepID=UPI0003FD0AF2|nr:Gfo/Idh/MocA family oxidoreductase [Inquilinus limosus]
MSDKPVGVGIIGCGVISGAYLKAAAHFPILRVRACADLNPEAAQAKAAEFGIAAVSIEQLLADPEIEIVLNLTTPQAHVPVGLQAIAAGKHVHAEKPLAVSVAEGRTLLEAARAKELRVGSAPDTFLGAGQQTARALIDAGRIGRPVAGTAFMMVPGHERWHPNPDFYYAKGGGPLFDMGPYYLTTLVNMLGPVARVTGTVAAAYTERRIASGPRAGQVVPVDTPTHITGTLAFASGAVVTMVMSFDIPAHRHAPIEIYGETASLSVPDPNTFGGEVLVSVDRTEWKAEATGHAYGDGNYRIIGVADLAQAIRTGRPHRASAELAFHVLEVMEAVERSGREGRPIEIESRCDRPQPMPVEPAFGRAA